MMNPTLSAVFALYSLQKATILTPLCPRAGPIGGAGFAFPASIANLIILTTFFWPYFFYLFLHLLINKE